MDTHQNRDKMAVLISTEIYIWNINTKENEWQIPFWEPLKKELYFTYIIFFWLSQFSEGQKVVQWSLDFACNYFFLPFKYPQTVWRLNFLHFANLLGTCIQVMYENNIYFPAGTQRWDNVDATSWRWCMSCACWVAPTCDRAFLVSDNKVYFFINWMYCTK